MQLCMGNDPTWIMNLRMLPSKWLMRLAFPASSRNTIKGDNPLSQNKNIFLAKQSFGCKISLLTFSKLQQFILKQKAIELQFFSAQKTKICLFSWQNKRFYWPCDWWKLIEKWLSKCDKRTCSYTDTECEFEGNRD